MIEVVVNQYGQDVLTTKQWTFPCGESGFKIENIAAVHYEDVFLKLVYESNDDLFALAQAVDAVKNAGAKSWNLYMPYLPYSRQDRRCNDGEGHGLKVFASFINSLGFDRVYTDDAHSTVAEALFDNFFNNPQAACAQMLPKYDFLVAPDAGAEKKVYTHRQVAQGTMVITASKTRDAEGKITGTHVSNGFQVADFDVCIVDDLCDGGATFISLAEELRKYGPNRLDLYVTHGMFTNPAKFQLLYERFDNIYVHNLYNKSLESFVLII